MLSACLILPSDFTAGKLILCNYKILLKFNSAVDFYFFLNFLSKTGRRLLIASVKLDFVTFRMRWGAGVLMILPEEGSCKRREKKEWG